MFAPKPQSGPAAITFRMRGRIQVLVHKEAVDGKQNSLKQSLSRAQASFSPQGLQSSPPQSTPVSFPLAMPSVQFGKLFGKGPELSLQNVVKKDRTITAVQTHNLLVAPSIMDILSFELMIPSDCVKVEVVCLR